MEKIHLNHIAYVKYDAIWKKNVDCVAGLFPTILLDVATDVKKCTAEAVWSQMSLAQTATSYVWTVQEE